MTPTSVIGAYTAAATIDGSTNFLLIQPGNSSTAYRKINRNVFLGVTGQPADLTTGQGFSNKILDNTNVITIKDNLLTLQDGGDITRQAQFQLSGITSGQTRIFTLPDATSTLANLTSTQTFTNKTLTSPTITGGSIDNSTVTVDAISGHTTANSGTIYGVTVTAGKISGTSITAGTIGSTALAANAVQANQLATNAITLGYTQITGNITTTSGTAVYATGLGVLVTIPAGTRRVRVTAYSYQLQSSAVTSPLLTIWSGAAVGTLTTQLQQLTCSASAPAGTSIVWSGTPAPGNIAYSVGFANGSGGTTTTLSASAVAPAFILVEVI